MKADAAKIESLTREMLALGEDPDREGPQGNTAPRRRRWRS